MATTTFTIYTVAWQGQDGISSPGLDTPLAATPDGAVGTSTRFAREDHRHPLPVEELSVGDVYDETDIWSLGVVSETIRSYARRQGDVVVFSFVASLSQGAPSNSVLYYTSADLAIPDGETVDFIMIDSNGKGLNGKMVRSEGIDPDTGLPVVNGSIDTISAIPAGTVRGQLVWMIEPEEEE